jgi:hypothetical protein
VWIFASGAACTHVIITRFFFKGGQRGSSPLIFQHKCVQRASLDNLNNPKIHRLVADLDAWRLLPLMTFQHNWNEEIICQFYATLWIDSQNLVLHWLTQGVHYRCDYQTFSRLLGFTSEDRAASSLFDIYPDYVSHDDLEAAQIYKPGKAVDFTTTHLKPYFYVLNNLLCLTLDLKIEDSIHIMLDAPKVLCRFGAGGDRFSITDFMWLKIEQAANDPHKSLPYALFLMYIEQVVGRSFHHNVVHKSYSVRHLGPKGIGGGSAPSPTRGPATRTSSHGAYHGGAATAPTRSSSERRRRGGGVIKYVLGKLWEAFCYKAEKDDRRLRRIEQHLQIYPPESPLREFWDPFVEYNELYGAPVSGLSEEASPSDDPRGKNTAPASPGLVDYSTDDDDDDDSDSDDDRDYTKPYYLRYYLFFVFFSYPFLSHRLWVPDL